MSLLEEFWSSIKSFDTEEKLDLYFYRPAGFAIAKLGQKLKMTPTQLTLLGLFSGMAAGVCFTQSSSTFWLLVGAILFLLSGIFDSSDGQLARLTGVSTKLGLVLDGICDSVVTISVYSGATYALTSELGNGIWVFTLLALVMHSSHCSILDFYNREYLYLGYGKTGKGDYWNPNLDEALLSIKNATTFSEKILLRLRFSWLRQQHFLSSRTPEQRVKMREILLGSDEALKERFMNAYRDHNRLILRFWRILGTNSHTISIIFFIFLRSFELHLVLVDVLFMNVALFCIRHFQKRQDQKLYNEFFIS